MPASSGGPAYRWQAGGNPPRLQRPWGAVVRTFVSAFPFTVLFDCLVSSGIFFYADGEGRAGRPGCDAEVVLEGAAFGVRGCGLQHSRIGKGICPLRALWSPDV